MTKTIEAAAIDDMRTRFSGQLLGPDDAGYEDARKVHNGMIDKRPGRHCQVDEDIA